MRKLVAALVLVGVLAGGWFYFRTRVITVWLYTDYAFRFNHSDWTALLDRRVKALNFIYKRNKTGVLWKVVDSSQSDPTRDINGIDNRRASMVFHFNDKAEVFVILTGIPEKDRTGSVSPFTRVAVVEDFPDKSEAVNARILAHELAHLFGAPQDRALLQTLLADTPEEDKFPDRTAALIRRMRNYPFASGIDGLSQTSWEKKALTALADDDTPPNQNPLGHAHTVLGTALLNERKKDAALAHFRLAVDADPSNVNNRFNLAEAYTRSGQDDKALEQVREAARLDPDKALSHRALGAVLARTHQPEEAVRELQTAARMEPNNIDTMVLLATAQANEFGHIDDAIATFQEAVRLDPSARIAQQGLDKVQALKARLTEALATERVNVQHNPTDPDAHYRLAKAEARAGDLPGAIRDFQKSADLRPGSGTPHAELAQLYLLQGDVNGAWEEVRKARALGTEPPATLISHLPAAR